MADLASLTKRLEAICTRLEKVESQIQAGGGGGGGGAGAAEPSVFVDAYQKLVDQHLKPLQATSKGLDSVLGQQADLLLQVAAAQKDLLQQAATCKKPSDSELQALLAPTNALASQIIELREKNRPSKFFNNLSVLSEGVPAFGWVAVSPTPGPFVDETRGSAEFYGNRILKDFKGKDEKQVEFVQQFMNFLKDLRQYIKDYHTTGLSWNPQGGAAKAGAVPAAAAAAKPAAAAAPAKPAAAAAPAKPGGANAGLFAELNKGGGVTSGLKKVTDDMKTKNQKDRPTGVVPAGKGPAGSAAKPAGGAAKPAVQKPPKLALEGTRWAVEYQEGNKNIVIDATEPKHTVYIFKCNNSVVQIKGKVNQINVDNCKKLAVVFDTVVASFEVVNSQSVEVQVTGSLHNVAIDKTNGCQVYLSKDSVGADIITSTSSEVNVSFPVEGKQDLVENAVPEQMKSFVKDGKLTTEIVYHTG